MKLKELIEKLKDIEELMDISDLNPDVEIQHNTPYNVDKNLKSVDYIKGSNIINIK